MARKQRSRSGYLEVQIREGNGPPRATKFTSTLCRCRLGFYRPIISGEACAEIDFNWGVCLPVSADSFDRLIFQGCRLEWHTAELDLLPLKFYTENRGWSLQLNEF
ncbi:hypothetical protein AHAS_Ahas05G0053800 [Arachis hypogaea]